MIDDADDDAVVLGELAPLRICFDGIASADQVGG